MPVMLERLLKPARSCRQIVLLPPIEIKWDRMGFFRLYCVFTFLLYWYLLFGITMYSIFELYFSISKDPAYSLCVCVRERCVSPKLLEIVKLVKLFIRCSATCQRINFHSTHLSCCQRQYYKSTETDFMPFKFEHNFCIWEKLK